MERIFIASALLQPYTTPPPGDELDHITGSSSATVDQWTKTDEAACRLNTNDDANSSPFDCHINEQNPCLAVVDPHQWQFRHMNHRRRLDGCASQAGGAHMENALGQVGQTRRRGRLVPAPSPWREIGGKN
jgi:hypothetical protein